MIVLRVCSLRRKIGSDVLLRWTLYASIGAEYATVPRFRLQPNATPRTLIEVNAGIRRHLFGLLKTALRTSDRRFQHNHFNSGSAAFLSVSIHFSQ